MLFALLGLSCAGRPQAKWSLAQSRCAAADHMVFSGDLETIYGRLRRIVGARFPAFSDDPLLRTFQIAWHPVDADRRETVMLMGQPQEQITHFEMRFSVTLAGDGPYRLLIRSLTRARRVIRIGDKLAPMGGFVAARTPVRFEQELRDYLRQGLREFESDCRGGRKQVDCSPLPAGRPEDFAPPADLPKEFSVASPLLCQRGSAYIQVQRHAGARRLGTARQVHGGFREGCLELPRPPADPSPCPSINAIALLHEVARRLRRQGITVAGTGLGPCGNAQGDYRAWNMSVGVFDWKEVPRAIVVIAQVMREYDVQGVVGVAVRARGDSCGVELSSISE